MSDIVPGLAPLLPGADLSFVPFTAVTWGRGWALLGLGVGAGTGGMWVAPNKAGARGSPQQ